MKLASEWKDYKVLATGGGEKLEDWAGVLLLRPDPQIIWQSNSELKNHKGLYARYLRSEKGGGEWELFKQLPEDWTVNYKDLTFKIKPTNFKHTGLFPEQSYNWDKIRGLIKNQNRPINILNLFAYTGGATVAAASAGAKVTHVDAAKGMVAWAKENCALSHIPQDKVRFIVDDCTKFINREIKREVKYDGIILDPPSYGRASGGSVWKLEDNLFELLTLCRQVLSDKPLFVLLNSYTTGLGTAVMQNMLNLALKDLGGTVESYELCLPTEESGIVLPCGNSAIWSK